MESIWRANLDLSVQSSLLLVELVIVVRVHLEIVELEFLFDLVLISI